MTFRNTAALWLLFVLPGFGQQPGPPGQIPACGPVGPNIPSYAVTVSNIQTHPGWHWNHDKGTPGEASGESAIVADPSITGSARQFDSQYDGYGGEIYSVSYAKDALAHHFVYDVEVYIAAGSSLKNLELDSNQVISNGNTVIYAFQCNGFNKTWDYSGAGAHWVHSKQPCNVSTWAKDTWHHVQIAYHRDDSGNVTYEAVWLDGTEQPINETVPSSFPLHWASATVQLQFQIDGDKTGGSSTLYADRLQVSRW